jgi:hypothetical protein
VITIVKAWVAVALLLSVTWTVKLNVPAVFGVPLITPVEGASVRPPGRAPDVTDQAVKIPLPPEAARVCE